MSRARTRRHRPSRGLCRTVSLAAFATAAGVVLVVTGPAVAGPAEEALVRQSGLARAEVHDMLTHCDDDQQAMYFCAWRDLIVQEQALAAAMAARAKGHPGCLARLQRAARAFRKDRDRQCKASAHQDYGGGSMEPTADLVCRQSSTHDYIGEVSRAACS